MLTSEPACSLNHTDYGWLTAYIGWEGDDKGDGSSSDVYVDEAWLSLGPLLAGKTASTYDYGGGFTWDGSDLDSDNSHNQLRLSWAASGFGVMLGIEDSRDRLGTSSTNDMPDLIAAITASQGPWDAKLSVGFTDLVIASGWGAQVAATVKLDQIAAGDAFRVKGAYSSDAGSFSGTPNGLGDAWSALASFQHFWQANLSSAVTFSYADPISGVDYWSVAGNLVWSPVHNFSIGGEVIYYSASALAWPDSITGKIRLERDWGG